MSTADQIEQQLSMQAAQLMRAAIMIARALSAHEAAARRAAARASLEHARALRAVTEQQRRLAAPIYRAAGRDGWWDDPQVSAAERARAVGLAERFAHVDEDAREVAAEAHRRLEAEARAREAAEARAREESRNPRSFRDQRKDELIDMTLSVPALAAAMPLVDGEKLEQSAEEILEELRVDARATSTGLAPTQPTDAPVVAPEPAPGRGDAYTATQMLATAPDEPVSEQVLDAPELTGNTVAVVWDSAEARHAWAQHLLDAGIDADGVRAVTVASQAQSGPTQDMLATPVTVTAGRAAAAPRVEQTQARHL